MFFDCQPTIESSQSGFCIVRAREFILDRFKRYFLEHFEQFFVLIVLISTAFINHFIDQRLAFLNFFFLPVILSAYYLGIKKAVHGSILITVLVLAYVILDPQKYLVQYDSMALYLHWVVWGSFLLLSAVVVGSQKDKLELSMKGERALIESLQENQKRLNSANVELKGYSENLEEMVTVRTEELEASRAATENMKGRVEAALYSTIDSSVAKLIIEGRIRSDKRQISVMFADLVGFTSYSEDRTPENVVRDVNHFLKKMEPILYGFHGHLDKFLGDGIMCQFGAPVSLDNYRLFAVLTAFKMQEAMRSGKFPWHMRIGIASGAAITGLIGSTRLSYTSIGDVVNVAARLEKTCPETEIVIDDFTYEGCRHFFETEPFHLEPISAVEASFRAQILELRKEIDTSSDSVIKAKHYAAIAALQVEVGDIDDGIKSYELALVLGPENQRVKIAMAEAVISREHQGSIQVKGRKKSVKAYKVLALKDPLADFARVPKSLGRKFRAALEAIPIPNAVPLRVEAIDGSIGHSSVVALLCYAIASRMNEFDRENVDIMLAGYAADLGKEIIPPHLLNSKGTLTATEMQEIHKHPAESVRLLKNLGYNASVVLEIVGKSHERLDGSGYPGGLHASAIPLGARIVAVADAYSAMTSWRAYREKWDQTAATDELRRLARAGKFDSEVVEALVDLLAGNFESKIVTFPSPIAL
jgi:HD-GYP domain-containing protein (c-di-GMP phosphodiesterase class II)